MSIHRSNLALLLGMMLGSFGASHGPQVIRAREAAPDPKLAGDPNESPRRKANGGAHRGNVARAIRRAEKRDAAKARAPKKSPQRRANIGVRMAAARAQR